ncbi:bifunctional molybdenum cofactor biosynthesis protein MoaC/MogA [compost metagenome]
MISMQKTKKAMLSRAVSGIRGRTLIINLPGSPKGVQENLMAIIDQLPHALGILTGKEGDHG